MRDEPYKLADPGAHAALESLDMYAEPYQLNPGWVAVRDEEVILPETIDGATLRQILMYGDKCRREGERLGRSALKHQLINLIGAQPAAS